VRRQRRRPDADHRPLGHICAGARGLRRDKGAPPAGGSEAGYHQAACDYYGACADGSTNYAAKVMARAKLYGFVAGTATDPAGLPVAANPVGAGCGGVAIAAGDGGFVVDPGANRRGVDLAPSSSGSSAAWRSSCRATPPGRSQEPVAQ
jgi:hypothetical protein